MAKHRSRRIGLLDRLAVQKDYRHSSIVVLPSRKVYVPAPFSTSYKSLTLRRQVAGVGWYLQATRRQHRALIALYINVYPPEWLKGSPALEFGLRSLRSGR